MLYKIINGNLPLSNNCTVLFPHEDFVSYISNEIIALVIYGIVRQITNGIYTS